MAPNYKLGKIYKLVSSETEDFYVGSTSQRYLSSRMALHRAFARTKAGGKWLYNTRLYNKIREVGELSWQIVLIEVYPCTCREELFKREEEIRKELKPTLNGQRAYRSKEDNLADAKIRYHKDKVRCPCGKLVSQSCLAKHRARPYHIKRTENNGDVAAHFFK